MTIFVDTSALYALLDADDEQHQTAKVNWITLLDERADLLCSNYILVEITALVQSRLGMEAVRIFYEDMRPIIRIEWVSEVIHQAATTALLTTARRRLSLVDCVSFALMRRLGIKQAFAFDEHFAEQGFEVIS